MIAKGNTHKNGVRLAAYMTTGKEGERAELWQLRGFEATTIRDAFRDVQIMAGATRCEHPFFHLQIRLRDNEKLSRPQWEQAADRIERMLGLAGQPRAIAFHTFERNRDEHMHVVWSRIDEETLKAIPLPFFKERLKKISRELELHFALEPVTNERKGEIKYAPTRGEFEQARRLGLDAHALRETIRACFERADCGASFQAALEQEGFVLAQGEKRDFVVIDPAGGLHALGKRILDVSAARIRERLSDLNRDELPGVAMARAFVHELEKEKLQEKDGPVWDRERADRDWQDAVIRAAIEKEKAEGQYADPRERKNTENGRQEKGQGAERALDANAAAIRLAWSLSHTPQDFARNLHECGFALASVTREEAEQSHRAASFAREAGRFAPEYREGEFVAIHERGQVYSLNRRTTGKDREEIEAFMRSFDAGKLQGIEAARREFETHKRPAPARDLWERQGLTAWQSFDGAGREQTGRAQAPEHLNGRIAEIRTSYMRSDNARSFVRALEERGFTLALVTSEDVAKSRIERHAATPSKTPQLREGDFVAIAEDARVYNLNARTTGASADKLRTFMAPLDRKAVMSVYQALERVEARGALREIERQAFRDLTRGQLKRAKDPRPTGRVAGASGVGGKVKAVRPVIATGEAVTRAAGKALDFLSGAFDSLIAPEPTPEQKLEARIDEARRKVEAGHVIDFSQFTSELARLQEKDQERERSRERGGRER